MSLTAAVSGSVLVLLSVSVVQGQEDWGVTYSSTQICALKGSTVDIPCTYTYPASTTHSLQETLWFTELKDKEPLDLRADPEYAGRVEYLFKQNDCTLRIKDLRERDSAEYKFRFTANQQGGSVPGSPGVTLTVTDLQVKMTRSVSHAQLRCHSSCTVSDNPSYIWYRNGKEIHRGSPFQALVNERSSYYCALEHEEHHSPAVYQPTEVTVSVSPSEDIVENKSMTLTCSSDAKPAAKYTWYKKHGLTRRPYVSIVRPNFSSVRPADSGEYFCTAENQLGSRASGSIFIDVKYAPVETSVSLSPSSEIVEGRSVFLVCSSDANPAAEFTWYKKTGTWRHERLSNSVHTQFKSIRSSDSGEYYCTAQNKLGKKTSGHIFVDVKYAPKLPSVSVSPSAEIVEGSSVTLTCSSDANPAANYTWFKEDEDSPKASGEIFTITDFRVNNSGNYFCEAENTRGASNRTFQLAFVSKSSVLKMNSIRLVLSFLVLVLLLLLALWVRKKKPLSHDPEAAEPAEMIELKTNPQHRQTEDAEEQEDVM